MSCKKRCSQIRIQTLNELSDWSSSWSFVLPSWTSASCSQGSRISFCIVVMPAVGASL